MSKKIRTVSVKAKTAHSKENIWDIAIDIKNWDKLIKFVKKIYMKDDVKEGAVFYDITAILIIPGLVRHKIIEIEPNKKLYVEAYIPFNSGKMFQTISIKDLNGKREIEIEIKYYISFFIFDLIFGKILEHRLKDMIVSSLKNAQLTLDKKYNKDMSKLEIITN